MRFVSGWNSVLKKLIVVSKVNSYSRFMNLKNMNFPLKTNSTAMSTKVVWYNHATLLVSFLEEEVHCPMYLMKINFHYIKKIVSHI